MKAVVLERYGPPEVLRVAEVDRPVPKDDEVLVRVHASTVNRTDWGFRRGTPPVLRLFNGFLRPKRKILGTELSGIVQAAGAAVTEFKVGEAVFGVNPWRFGAHAEYVCVPQSAPLAHKPEGLRFDEAAAVGDGGILGLLCLRAAKLRKGQSIAVYGASGSIGTAAVQLAKHFEAEVTAVCNTMNIEVVRSLGPARVVDYTKTDFPETGRKYDVILDAVDKLPFRRCRGALARDGIFVATDGFANLLLALSTPWLGGPKVVLLVATRFRKEDLLLLRDLVVAGEYRPVIDRRYPLAEVVEASRYVETGQKTGNVVLTIGAAAA